MREPASAPLDVSSLPTSIAHASDLVNRMRAAGAEADHLARMDLALQGRLVDLIIEVGRASRALAPYLPFPRLRLPGPDRDVDVCIIQDTIVSPPKIRIPALHIGIGLDVGAGDLLTFIGEIKPPVPEAVEEVRRSARDRAYRFRHYADEAGSVAFGTRPSEAILEQLVSAFEVAQRRIGQHQVRDNGTSGRLARMLERLQQLGIRVDRTSG